jgi:hypothetical protein
MYTFIFIIIVFLFTLIINIRANNKTLDKNIARENADFRGRISFVFMIIGVIIINVSDIGEDTKEEEDPPKTAQEIEKILNEHSTAADVTDSSAAGQTGDVQAYTEEDIDKQFHPWDGAHIKTEELVEASMKDPDSYEHVKSEYKVREGYLEVKLTYRGKNSFNATTTEVIRTKCDLQSGEVLEIIN